MQYFLLKKNGMRICFVTQYLVATNPYSKIETKIIPKHDMART